MYSSDIQAEVDILYSSVSLAAEYYSEERGRALNADDVVEIVMHIYVPEGAVRAGVRVARKSTWLNPVVNGVEAARLLHEPLVLPLPLLLLTVALLQLMIDLFWF